MKIKHVSKTYKTKYETVQALTDINLILPSQGMVFIVGVSGSGKTTLMNILSGVDTPTNGEVVIGEKSLFGGHKKEMFGYRNSYVGLIFQDYNLIEDINVYDNIKLPLDFMGTTDFSIVDEVIKQVDIEEIKFSKINEISSGQMQRVAIARALVKNSSLILADEPTGNLDAKNEKIVMDLLKEISRDRLVVVITHDEDAASEYGDRIIEIEDGTILEDTNPIQDVKEATPVFVEPKITWKEQLKLTLGFMRNSFGRSLSIFLVLLLVPILGVIMSGYVFFDVAKSYKDFQDEYGSEYITLSKQEGDFLLYYSDEEAIDRMLYYKDSNLVPYYDTSIDINPDDKPADYFYQPAIKHIVVMSDLFEVDGNMPQATNEILVSDYVMDAIEYYQGQVAITKLMVDGYLYNIVGVVKTSYSDFKEANLLNDYTRMAFEENLTTYNAVYTTEAGYEAMRNNMIQYYETVSFTVYSGKPIPETKYEEVKVSRERSVDLIRGGNIIGPGYGLVSSALFEDALEMEYSEFYSGVRAIFYCFSKTKYRISVRISGIFESDEYEIILRDSDFETNVAKQTKSRLLISKEDANYKEIVTTENVTNPSFVYARAMWDKAKGAQIALIEFLIVLIILVITFAQIMNNFTISAEKKKIGIKYSFGIKEVAIVIPYIMEMLIYIGVGFVLSTLVSKVAFPIFMNTFIYTSEFDRMAFDFFYISWRTLLGWDGIIYSIMFVSLLVMIY
ncbi:MAG: ABC transporter ATP-binding protein, partial [Bacilli bacterium]|nr:ABC transporter ATP-binding protein [Bacilli bacterium]